MPVRHVRPHPAWFGVVLFGLSLTVHGYQSRDGDQAYRLPLLIDRQVPGTYAADPFVRAFDDFNPHLGSLFLLDGLSRSVGLSATLFGLLALSFALAAAGLARMFRESDPGIGPLVGLLPVALVLIARAGNIGTNHLFEPMFLDRGLALGLGWVALAALVGRPAHAHGLIAACLGAAAWIHPSLGLQLAILVGITWTVLALAPERTGLRIGLRALGAGLGAVALALMPAVLLQAGGSARLLDGLPADEMLVLAGQIQSPQHMIPSLWRHSQWLAFGGYLGLAGFALATSPRPWAPGKIRLAILLGAGLAFLAIAYLLIEVVREPRAVLFQPFRVATVVRGLALVPIAGHVQALWRLGTMSGRGRAALIVAGLAGDWAMVVATVVELSAGLASLGPARFRFLAIAGPAGILAFGLDFLRRHDTARGHLPILSALGFVALVMVLRWVRPQAIARGWTPRRLRWALTLAWALPVAAAVVPWLGDSAVGKLGFLVARCRFYEDPVEDMERLALWCRRATPSSARFIGPPQPKTFRLWARRSLAFNRSGSPYHARGLADWSARFRDHVGFSGDTRSFARAYLANRQELERGYARLSDAERADLARRQGADHVIAGPPEGPPAADEPLEFLHREGRYAVYRVRERDGGPDAIARAPAPSDADLRRTAASSPD